MATETNTLSTTKAVVLDNYSYTANGGFALYSAVAYNEENEALDGGEEHYPVRQITLSSKNTYFATVSAGNAGHENGYCNLNTGSSGYSSKNFPEASVSEHENPDYED